MPLPLQRWLWWFRFRYRKAVVPLATVFSNCSLSSSDALANAFLDGWAKEKPYERIAINWPGWSEAGMVKNLLFENDFFAVLRALQVVWSTLVESVHRTVVGITSVD